jgi:hypothetical protein
MVFSYYLLKAPYRLVWNVLHLFKKRSKIVFYCANELDLDIFKNVQKFLVPLPIVVKNKRMKQKLKLMGIESRVMPVYPKAVIMCRQACYLFPESKIIRIGMRHGAYHFKRFAGVKGYNMFSQFHFSSSKELEEAQQMGITSGVGLGFPKMDDAFNGTYSDIYLQHLKKEIGLDENKKTLLFSATWDGSGMSAIDQWYDKLDQFTEEYNVVVTVHVWMSESFKTRIKETKKVYFLENIDVIPYLMISDVCVGDASSIISEMCALHKPIVSFKIPRVKRTVPEVREIIENISFQINNFEELAPMLTHALFASEEKKEARDSANERMFEKLDGKAGERVAAKILELLPELEKQNK